MAFTKNSDPDAWETSAGEGITMAILDSGVEAVTSNNSTDVASAAWNTNIIPIRFFNEPNGVEQYSSLAFLYS